MKIAVGRPSRKAAAATWTLFSALGNRIAAPQVLSPCADFGEPVAMCGRLVDTQSRNSGTSCAVSFDAQNHSLVWFAAEGGYAFIKVFKHAIVPGLASFLGPSIGYRDSASATTFSFPGLYRASYQC